MIKGIVHSVIFLGHDCASEWLLFERHIFYGSTAAV